MLLSRTSLSVAISGSILAQKDMCSCELMCRKGREFVQVVGTFGQSLA